MTSAGEPFREASIPRERVRRRNAGRSGAAGVGGQQNMRATVTWQHVERYRKAAVIRALRGCKAVEAIRFNRLFSVREVKRER